MKSKSDPATKASAGGPLRENILFLKEVETRLKKARVASPKVEAEEFLKHFGKMNRLDLFTGKKSVSAAARRQIAVALKKRVRGTPLQHLLGEWPFFGHSFYVSKDVLIPRPETEVLAEATLEAMEGKKTPKILDLCTGSGCLAVSLTISRPECRMTASDISQKALSVACKNSNRHKLGTKVTFVRSDLFGAFRGSGEKWDVIVTNPPYIPRAEIRTLSREVRHDPKLALDGGKSGLDLIEKILQDAPHYLEDGGTLLMEIGKGQSRTLGKKYPAARFVKDHSGVERILILKI